VAEGGTDAAHSQLNPSARAGDRYLVLGGTTVMQIAITTLYAGFAPLLPFVKTEFGLTYAQAGLIANVAFVGTMATLLAAGWAVDALGERIVIIAGGFIAGLAGIAAGLAPFLALLVVALVVLGVGVGTATPSGTSAIRAAFARDERAVAMGVRQMGIPVGGLLAALILPSLAQAHGWRFGVVAAGVVAVVIALVLAVAYPRRRRGLEASRQAGRAAKLTKNVALTGAAGNFLLAGQICVVTYLVVFLVRDWGMSVTAAGFLLALAQGSGALGRLGWGLASDRLLNGSRRTVLIMAGLVSAGGCLVLSLLPSTSSHVWLGITIAVLAAGAVGWTGVQMTLLSELAAPGFEGRTVALGMFLQQPALLLAPLAFGALVDWTGSFRIAWQVLAAFVVIGALLLFGIREAKPELDHAVARSS
jgi:MFS family permease